MQSLILLMGDLSLLPESVSDIYIYIYMLYAKVQRVNHLKKIINSNFPCIKFLYVLYVQSVQLGELE